MAVSKLVEGWIKPEMFVDTSNKKKCFDFILRTSLSLDFIKLLKDISPLQAP